MKSTVSWAAHDETEAGAHSCLLSYSLKPQGTDIILRHARQQQSAIIVRQYVQYVRMYPDNPAYCIYRKC